MKLSELPESTEYQHRIGDVLIEFSSHPDGFLWESVWVQHFQYALLTYYYSRLCCINSPRHLQTTSSRFSRFSASGCSPLKSLRTAASSASQRSPISAFRFSSNITARSLASLAVSTWSYIRWSAARRSIPRHGVEVVVIVHVWELVEQHHALTTCFFAHMVHWS